MRLLFVMSTNYAGSTLLGLVAAGHPRVAFLGEPATLLRRDRDGGFRHQRFCSICRDDGSRCPVWTKERISSVREDPDRVYDLANEGLSAAIGERDILVDASKDMAWMDAGTRRVEHVACVHITKPVESFVASVLNRNEGRGRLDFISADWVIRNEEIRRYCVEKSVPYLHVRYTDLASNSEYVVSRLCGFLGLEPVAAQSEFWLNTHHYIKGNPGTASHFSKERAEAEPGINKQLYKENHRRIFVDEKWKNLLTASQIDMLYADPAVAQESSILGYSHPTRLGGSPVLSKMRARTLGRGLALARAVARTAREIIS